MLIISAIPAGAASDRDHHAAAGLEGNKYGRLQMVLAREPIFMRLVACLTFSGFCRSALSTATYNRSA